MTRQKLWVIAVVLLFSASFAGALLPAATLDKEADDPLAAWAYENATNWSVTTRKHTHSAQASTPDGFEKVLEFYKGRISEITTANSERDGYESSSGSRTSSSGEGKPAVSIGWALVRTNSELVSIHLFRAANDDQTHISVVRDVR